MSLLKQHTSPKIPKVDKKNKLICNIQTTPSTNYTPTENNNPIPQLNPPSQHDTRLCCRNGLGDNVNNIC
jgi:hypothetical protein